MRPPALMRVRTSLFAVRDGIGCGARGDPLTPGQLAAHRLTDERGALTIITKCVDSLNRRIVKANLNGGSNSWPTHAALINGPEKKRHPKNKRPRLLTY